jgi:hypothetical protein
MAEACTPGPLAVEPLPSSGQLGSPGANGRGCAAAKEDSGWRMEDGKTAWRGTWSHAPGGSGTESWRQILRERCFPIRYEGRQYATLGADTWRLRRSQSRGPKVEGRRLGKHLEITWRAERGEPEGTAREKPPQSHTQATCKPGAWEVLACCHRILFVFSWYSPLVLRWCLPRHHGGSTEPLPKFDTAGLSGIQMKAPFPEP